MAILILPLVRMHAGRHSPAYTTVKCKRLTQQGI